MENATLNSTLNGTINGTAGGNVTFTATTEGFLLAYSSLFTMAIVPIIIGSLQSVAANKLNKETGEVETMTSKDAAMFPLYASAALFGIYLFFKLISKEYINMLLAFYFFLLGVLALTQLLKPVYHKLLPASLPNRFFNNQLRQVEAALTAANDRATRAEQRLARLRQQLHEARAAAAAASAISEDSATAGNAGDLTAAEAAGIGRQLRLGAFQQEAGLKALLKGLESARLMADRLESLGRLREAAPRAPSDELPE